MNKILFNIHKSPIPVIWLDTSIIFSMTLLKTNRPISKTKKQQIEYLFQKIYDLTRQKKLICPRADQDEEIWIEREDCLNLILELSLGIKAKYSEAIKDFQTFQFMEAFLNDKYEIDIKYEHFFIDNPIQELENKSNYVVDVDLGLIEKSHKIQERKKRELDKVEKLRQENVQKGVTYEEQLKKEYKSEIQLLFYLLEKRKKGNLSNIDSWALDDIINQYSSAWEKFGGNLSNLKDFFISNHYRAIPFNNINSKMAAKIITSTDPIKSGHTMDMYHASSALPYVDIFITDRYMKHLIIELELDKQYDTKVCYIGDKSEINSFFNDI